MSSPRHGQQGEGQQGTDLITTICERVAQEAQNTDGSKRQALDRAITSAWSTLTSELPTIDRGRLERRQPPNSIVSGKRGFEVLSHDAQQALSAMAYFADSPGTYLQEHDLQRVDQAVGQIAMPLVQALTTAGIAVPADAQQTAEQLVGSERKHQ